MIVVFIGSLTRHFCFVRCCQPEEVTVEEIYQFWIKCSDDRNKFQVLDTLYGVLTIGQSIIFVQHVKTAKWLAAEMEKAGHKVSKTGDWRWQCVFMC